MQFLRRRRSLGQCNRHISYECLTAQKTSEALPNWLCDLTQLLGEEAQSEPVGQGLSQFPTVCWELQHLVAQRHRGNHPGWWFCTISGHALLRYIAGRHDASPSKAAQSAGV